MNRTTLRFPTLMSLGTTALLGGILTGVLTGQPSVAKGGDDNNVPTYAIGSSLPGLSPSLQTLFLAGKNNFTRSFSPAEGLGPIYNDTNCVSCHGAGATGGGDPLGVTGNVTHFAFDNTGVMDFLRDLGGSVIQNKSIRDNGVPGCPMAPETVPAVANAISIRNSPPVFGFGLLDAIPDSEILKRQGLSTDGVAGFANWGMELQAKEVEPIQGIPLPIYGPMRVGRFGWKSQTATLFQFSAEPFNIELGVTSPFFPQDFTPQGTRFYSQLAPACQVADHAVNDVDNAISVSLYHFQALLAAPPPLAKDDAARAGEKVWKKLACANCHVEELRTGPKYGLLLADGTTVRVPQLENQKVHAYTDLLVHDMGPGLADASGANIGRIMGRADGAHWRTTPLWGIRFKTALLHDGRTNDIATAILEHGGEATSARNRFDALSAVEKSQLVAYLRTL